MRSRVMVAVVAALVLAAGGCGDDDDGGSSGADPGPPTAADLDGRTFVSTGAEGFTLVPAPRSR